MTVAFDIPDSLAEQLSASGKNPSRATLEALALEGYRNLQLSESQIRKLLRFDTRMEVHAFLAEHNVPLNYSFEDWQHDKQLADQSNFPAQAA